MAASLWQVCQLRTNVLNTIHKTIVGQQMTYSHKTKNRSRPKRVVAKFYDEHLAELYANGERKYDRFIGVQMQEEKPHPETVKLGHYELDPPKGHIYDKKPFPVLLKAGTRYKWCACGHSKHQPFCDGSHITINQKNIIKPRHMLVHHLPVTFTVPEDGEYWMCQCKQTNNRPFCDGSHLAEEVQQKIKS